MRTLIVAGCLLVAGGAHAQVPQFKNGTPIDYTKPFLADGVYVRPPPSDDVVLPVEVIGREQLLKMGNPSLREILENLAPPPPRPARDLELQRPLPSPSPELRSAKP